jgi:hypothetical protein
MAVDIMIQRTSGPWMKAMTDNDVRKVQIYPANQPLQSHIKGIRKERAYRELCCYKGSCTYIANMNFNSNIDTQGKVNFLTKIRCGFVESIIHDSKMNQVHFVPKSLAYANCDQPESHAFIADALRRHAALVGLGTDEYVRLLDD